MSFFFTIADICVRLKYCEHTYKMTYFFRDSNLLNKRFRAFNLVHQEHIISYIFFEKRSYFPIS